MTRREGIMGRSGRAHVWLAGAMLLGLAGLVGCTNTAGSLTRAQSDDEGEREHYGVKTVGDVTVVGNAEPVPLGGVGLVVSLEGTGGDSAQDSFRAMLVNALQKAGVQDVKKVLSSPNHALVIVEAGLPPGVNKGDPIDLQVKLPPGSRATSLRGGRLLKCTLFNYDFARHLSPEYQGNKGMLQGHPVASAEGPILVGVGVSDGDQENTLKQGRIWHGGRSKVDQAFALVMTPDNQMARIAALVAERVNETYQSGPRSPDTKIAFASNNIQVGLRVPVQYRLNLPRFLRVVRFIPLSNSHDAPLGDGTNRLSYRQHLAADLLRPERTVVAALRLEALGSRSIPLLKQGLTSKEELVRFCSAEALAYLGSPACGEELGAAVARQPLLRAFGLAALASLDEPVCRNKLREGFLFTSTDDETRYGAFRALRTLDENDGTVRGDLLNDSFWVHHIPSEAAPLVHVSSTRRAEVVLLGETPCLKPPFSFLAGEFAVTASEDDRVRCTVSRFAVGRPIRRKQCNLDLESVLRALADLGAMYPEAVAVIQQANSTASLTCRVRCDALPQAVSVYDLVDAGKGKEGAELLLKAGQDLGVTPTLYQVGLPTRSTRIREQEAMLNDRRPPAAASPE